MKLYGVLFCGCIWMSSMGAVAVIIDNKATEKIAVVFTMLSAEDNEYDQRFEIEANSQKTIELENGRYIKYLDVWSLDGFLRSGIPVDAEWVQPHTIFVERPNGWYSILVRENT